MDNRPIGVFDSGIGGLTVVRQILRVLPQEKIIYIGDTARVPWGTRGKKIIIEFSLQLARFLQEKRVKFIVAACHTASSIALEVLKKEIKIPVLGVIGPGVDEALLKTKNFKIGIIGTPATIRSNAWPKALRKKEPRVKTFSVACSLFVPLVEEGLFNHRVAEIMAKEYMGPVLSQGIDTLILACTHYLLLKETIIKVVGEKVGLINPGESTARFLAKTLRKRNLLSKNKKKGKLKLYLTDPNYKAVERLGDFFEDCEMAF